jgi:hypothetical protein
LGRPGEFLEARHARLANPLRPAGENKGSAGVEFLADRLPDDRLDVRAVHRLVQGLVDQRLVAAFAGLGLEKAITSPSSMIETRCLPSRSRTAAAYSGWLTSF